MLYLKLNCQKYEVQIFYNYNICCEIRLTDNNFKKNNTSPLRYHWSNLHPKAFKIH